MGIFGRKTTGLDKVGAEVEGDIRALVSRDIVEPRRQLASNDGDMLVHDLSMLLQRVSMNTMQEIDDLISDLRTLREQLQDSGERMAREIVGYASLSQTAIQSTKILAENLTHRRSES